MDGLSLSELPGVPEGLEGLPLLSAPPDEVLFLTASMSMVFSPFFSALSAAFCSERLCTGLNVARESKFSKSSPGVKMIFTPVMFFAVNASLLPLLRLPRHTLDALSALHLCRQYGGQGNREGACSAIPVHPYRTPEVIPHRLLSAHLHHLLHHSRTRSE